MDHNGKWLTVFLKLKVAASVGGSSRSMGVCKWLHSSNHGNGIALLVDGQYDTCSPFDYLPRQKAFLQIIAPEHESCSICHSTPDVYPYEPDHHWIETLTAACQLAISKSTASQLLRLPGGFFWVALARASRAEGSAAKAYPQRERQAPYREGYVDSAAAIPNSQGEIRVRVERKKTTVQVPGMYNFTAEDDGGLCWMDRQVHGWGMGLPTLAFLEAKRAFKFIHIDERMGEYQPIVSKGTLAQYLGEAIVT
ncbi:hypothetical protein ASPNIDRAFT_43266 [Aspergillus niger ATCC 1015]|uniref:Uncharacterized protein n=1 Tax=Aspergillus niger (strain ATCC 1015 / CBS 113.46 / FGSC A1144 / LSHB Ac4 / NCTC 3858a / NRRL 328 / USDA 3528.7) TaxID=380704 RepID=G3XMW2_ASPNA|nr:hypothetical protein ASPNIDRAFT_43266 [Aspergillus niger ATCC 1015]